MKKFKFNLEKLLEHRKKDVEKIQYDMAPYVSEYNKVMTSLTNINNNLKQYYKKRNHYIKSTQNLIHYTSSIGFLKQSIEHLEADKINKEEALNEWKIKLIEAVKKVKAIEYIKEKKYKEFKKQIQKQEQIEMDDFKPRENLTNA